MVVLFNRFAHSAGPGTLDRGPLAKGRAWNHGLGPYIAGSLDAKAFRGSLGGVLGLLFCVLGVSWSCPGEVPRDLGEALEASWVSVGALKDAWSSKGVLPGAYGGLWGGFGSRWVLKFFPMWVAFSDDMSLFFFRFSFEITF